MKDKPVSHKTQNTFRFQTFAERLSNINIDVIHQIKRTSEIPENRDTFFLETLEKWIDLNYTESFTLLHQDIGTEIQTLPQIVHRQEHLVQVLQKHLQIPNNLALDAILELIVALARDLQYDFYPYFPKIFTLIVQLLETKDTELLENIFTCLAYLCKFLWRYMVKDILVIFGLYAPLLSTERKEYIRNFAAESFGFLLRKCSDKRKLFDFIFKKIEANPNQIEGIGQLLFEIVKGVKKHFHSCTEIVFPLWMNSLGLGLDEQIELPWNLVEETLICTLSSMAQYTSKEYTGVIWKMFCETLKVFKLKIESDKLKDVLEKATDHLARVLRLFLHWVEYHGSILIQSPEELLQVLDDLCKVKGLPDICGEPLLQAGSALILACHSKLTMEIVNRYISSIFSSYFSRNLIFGFTRRMFHYGMFEKDVLPPLLQYCQNCISGNRDPSVESDILTILVELILHKQPLVMTGDDLSIGTKFYFDIPESSNMGRRQLRSMTNVKEINIENVLLDQLQCGPEDMLKNIPSVWAALVCLPHLRSLNENAAVEAIIKIVSFLQEKIVETSEDSDQLNKIGFVLCQSIVTCIRLKYFDHLFHVFSLESLISLITLNPNSLSLLSIADMYLTYVLNNKDVDSSSLLERIFPLIQSNLASPYHKIRLLTLRILSNFDYVLPSLDTETVPQTCLFDICLAAEKVPVSIQDFREKLKLLRKLEYHEIEKNTPIGPYEKVPLCYLLGVLYVNFRPLWQPVQELIKSHAQGLGKKFWEVFTPQLKLASELVEKTSLNDSSVVKKPVSSTDACYIKIEDLFLNNALGTYQHIDITDHVNYRIMLWRSMQMFSDIVEPRNREIIPLFLNFVRNELTTADDSLASFENVYSTGNMKADESENCSEDPKEENKEEEVEEQEEAQDDNDDEKEMKQDLESVEVKDGSCIKKRKRGATKSLVVFLGVFAKFQNPKALYKEEELRQLYDELLSYRDPAIQKLAFDCVMSYNYKFLTPYKENFFRLLDDKTFKTEIVLFNLDTESDVIREEHRAPMLPVLMRIMYGKMLHKSGANTSGRGQGHVRRSLVLRFLAGCKEQELQVFLDLAFSSFKEMVSCDSLTLVRKIRNEINLSAVVPLRKQLSGLSTMGTIFSYMGSLVPGLLPWLLKVLLAITATSVTLLEKRKEVTSSCVNLLKTLRTQSIMRLIQFFRSFDQYPFTPLEIDAIFDAVVWPMLPRLEFEALHSPPPLLRLLALWSEFPRYFVLLAKHHPADTKLSPLPHLMSLYTASRVKPRVVGFVTKMLDQLLSLEDYAITRETDEEQTAAPLVVNDCLPVSEARQSQKIESLNYGTKLLLPYVSHILKQLREIIGRTAKNAKKSLSERDLNILLRISEHVQDPDQSSDLIGLLIPFLRTKKNVDGETMILSAICNLIKYTEQPKIFIRSLAALLSHLSQKQSRMALVSVFSEISKKDSNYQQLSTVVTMMNSWNPKQMEEPDFNTRLSGHKMALQIINGMTDEVDVDFILLVIYNSSFVIRQNEDMSLRDNASNLLQKMTLKFSEFVDSKREVFKTVVGEVLLGEIQKGLRSKAEVVRHEFVQIFSSLLQSCGSHPQLADLAKLCDKDPDLDFWENIRHLQMHRRSRALVRFSQNITSGTLTISPHSLTTYMMPIISSFLFDDTYSKYNHVIDGAVEGVGAVCYRLPCHRYSLVFKHYLDLLLHGTVNKKIVIKVLVAVLNAFHFDLSRSQYVHCNLKEPPAKETKSKKDDESNLDVKEVEDIPVISSCGVEGENTEIPSLGKEILNEDKATKVHCNIAQNILPQLYKALTQKSQAEEEHKLAKHYYPEDEEILRAPIALAMLKLLQNLPHKELEKNIASLFLKMCHFLKSRAESIRETARETLIKMMQALGPKYLWFLVREMKGVMRRGYQVHVMTFTVHALLSSLKKQLKYGDLDNCLTSISEICNEEVFGNIAEEKEVNKIVGKLKEARNSKSYLTYQVLGQFVTHSHLTDLIYPLKVILDKTYSHKTVRKVHECLHKIAFGVCENEGLSVKHLLIFTYGTMTDSIPQLNKRGESKPPLKKRKHERPDIYLVPAEPPRGGIPPKASIKTNAYIITEFGLELLHFCLKREKLSPNNQEHLEMLDPFVPMLADCLNSQYIKVTSTATRCLSWIVKFNLPSLKEHTSKIVNSLFVLLNKYSGIGMAQGENFELVVACFKALTVVVRDVTHYTLSNENLQVLLSYIEQDIHDRNRQSTAFTLLKAILSRKLQSPELSVIMKKIAEMSVTSERDHVQTQCRQAYLQYLLEYPLSKQMKSCLSFFAAQLDYEHENGRVSAMEMINSIIACFPLYVLKLHAGLFFVPLAARLTNEESSKSRRMISISIKNLLSKLDDDEKNGLFSIVVAWIESNKISHQQLGVQLCGIFAEVEGNKFESRLNTVLPLFQQWLESSQNENVSEDTDQRHHDHFLYHLLSAVSKIFSACSVLRQKKFRNQLNIIWEHIKHCILHPHVWVRTISSQLFGLLFSVFPVNEVASAASNPSSIGDEYLLIDTRKKLRDLSADFCTQLQSPYLSETLGEQVVRNLIYLAKVIHRLPSNPTKNTENVNGELLQTEAGEGQKEEVSLEWMIRRMHREAKWEVALNPKLILRRTCVFKFLAAISVDLGKEELTKKLPSILPPLCREIADNSTTSDSSLKKLTQEVLDLIKSTVTVEVFTEEYVKVQSLLVKKKAKRKQEKAVEAVVNPMKSANKKIKRQLAKKEALKRKFAKKKGQKAKKAKLVDMAIVS